MDKSNTRPKGRGAGESSFKSSSQRQYRPLAPNAQLFRTFGVKFGGRRVALQFGDANGPTYTAIMPHWDFQGLLAYLNEQAARAGFDTSKDYGC